MLHCHGQVLLRLPKHPGNGAGPEKGQALVYATSWWNEDTVNEYLQDKRLPIWASLSTARTELYRDVQALYHGTSPFLDRQALATVLSPMHIRHGIPRPYWHVCNGKSCTALILSRSHSWSPGCLSALPNKTLTCPNQVRMAEGLFARHA